MATTGELVDLFEAIEKRYSARRYERRPVEEEKLRRIFEAARLAPSAKNLQEWRFVVAREPAVIAKLAEAAFQPFVGGAPVVVACCAETDGYVMRCGLPSHPLDVAIAIDHLTLAATALGLGTCWIGKFDPDLVREALGIPPEVVVVELLTLGYPADAPKAKNRLPLESIVKFDRWNY
jgi:nitroreductase